MKSSTYERIVALAKSLRVAPKTRLDRLDPTAKRVWQAYQLLQQRAMTSLQLAEALDLKEDYARALFRAFREAGLVDAQPAEGKARPGRTGRRPRLAQIGAPTLPGPPPPAVPDPHTCGVCELPLGPTDPEDFVCLSCAGKSLNPPIY